jgi:hypothetical protein
LAPWFRQLTVPAICRANANAAVSPGRNWNPFVRAASELYSKARIEQQIHNEAVNLEDQHLGHGRKSQPKAWLNLLETPLTVQDPLRSNLGAAQIIRVAGDDCFLGLPQEDEDALRRLDASGLPPDRDEFKRARRATESNLNFLKGSWWEIAVADCARRSGEVVDVRWSARTEDDPEAPLSLDSPEHDVLGVCRGQLVFISCKRGDQGEKLLSEMDRVRSAAERLGGRFTRKFLAIFLADRIRQKDPAHWQALEHRAQSLGVRILTKETVADPRSFALAP